MACAEGTRRTEAAEPAEEEDRPLVFLCSRCRRPLGDSLSWVTCQEDNNCILLRCQLPGRGGGAWGAGVCAEGRLLPGVPHLAAPEEAEWGGCFGAAQGL